MANNVFEGLKRVSLEKGIEVVTEVPIETLLGIIGLFDAYTLTRFLTNQEQHMIDFQFDTQWQDDNSRLITDGVFQHGKVVNAKYAAEIMPFVEGVRTENQVMDASHQVMVWVSKDHYPHKEFRKIFEDIVGSTNKRVTIEPNAGREKRI